MTSITRASYDLLDRPEVLMFLFHPRSGYAGLQIPDSAVDVLIPVDAEVRVGGRFHMTDPAAPNILFFHGNGEIVDDYLDIGQRYNQIGINFLAVDYRGYGRSEGNPTSSGMVRDSHDIFRFVENWLKSNDYTGAMMVMGRSLGSVPALELAVSYRDRIDGLIIESGFTYTKPLLRLIGVDVDALGYRERDGFNHIEKIAAFDKPTLIIHAEQDHIIPFMEGQALYGACPATMKTLLMIPHADHNTIYSRGIAAYMQAIKTFSARLKAK